MRLIAVVALFAAGCLFAQDTPKPIPGGYALPNGWRITPAGKSLPTEDMVLNVTGSPDGKGMVALHSGFNPHGIVVVDQKTDEPTQRIALKSAWLGMAWSPDGKKLFVSGGNAAGRQPSKAPIYEFGYDNGRLTDQPLSTLEDGGQASEIFWSGLVHHPRKNVLYALHRGTARYSGHVVVFDTETKKATARIKVDAIPYAAAISADGATLYVTNWASDTVSVIDTATNKVLASLAVGDNPNDLLLTPDGRLFVACAQDNSVWVIDTATRMARERINTALTPRALEGSTPNALAYDATAKMLFVANADNNSVAVVRVAEKGESEVMGFIPAGWYPSALALSPDKKKLFVGNSKGLGGYSNVTGPNSPLRKAGMPADSVKSLQKGSVQIVSLANLRTELREMTKRVYENVPYRDEFLAASKAPTAPTVVPREVGAGSPIKHVIYIIKENRTYDQVFGDLPQGNGDSRITIFGRKITPNHHKLAEEYVLFDNLYCDGEVSEDGHFWSTAAFATDANEKQWPVGYGGHGRAQYHEGYVPRGGYIWDAARKKGLTFRSYGEFATRASEGNADASQNAPGLIGHVAPNFKRPGMRDPDNVKEFIREFNEYESNYDSPDPEKRLPNFIVMSLGEDHTTGTRPGTPTPRASVASNDYAVGLLVERVTNSKYWPETAIFVIEDDAQDGPDHVDARRTVGLVISPYTKRGFVDKTLYTTSSMLRTMELLLGLPPMSQYDAAAPPMYNAFTDKANPAPYKHLAPQYDLNEMNTQRAWGARRSMEMNLDEYDRAPMFELNEIVWKSVKGAKSEMPLPVHRFWFGGR